MHFNMDWHIEIGRYKLAMLDSVEIHKSVDLLADSCVIKLPASIYNQALKIEDINGKDKIVRGDGVLVKLGYNGKLQEEFKGYLLNIGTDDGSITINCEDELFLLRKAVRDKEFKNKTVKEIAQYLLVETGLNVSLRLNCSLTIDYDKFVISKATAYDVLKKLQEETKGNIYIKNGALNIHPPYVENHGAVAYSFQVNIEQSDLKYKRAEDKKIEIVVESVGKDGKKKFFSYGTSGGDKKTVTGDGMSEKGIIEKAKNEYDLLIYDGYEGSITTWLIPYVENGYSATIKDEDYEYKDGTYYVTAVTTTMNNSGGVRKVQLGKKLANG